MIHEPPADVPADVLFRRLLRVPRAQLAVDVPLIGRGTVVAIAGQELREAHDEQGDAPDAVKTSRVSARIIALSLHDATGPVFASAAEVGQLEEDDFERVAAAVVPAVTSISPAFGVSNIDAWEARLAAGARHPSNWLAARALGCCYDKRTLTIPKGKRTYYEQHVTDRPDRYFGMPLGELTDGQWLCFRAAKQAVSR